MNNQVNRRFCTVVFRGKPLLCFPQPLWAGTNFLRGGHKHVNTFTKFSIMSGDDMLTYEEDKENVSEIGDLEISSMLLNDDRLCPAFVREANKVLTLDPIRPGGKW